jgi:hypothetical protein
MGRLGTPRGQNALLLDVLPNELKLESAAAAQRYLFKALREGRFNLPERHGEWDSIPCEFLDLHYRDWCEQEGIRPGAPAQPSASVVRARAVGEVPSAFWALLQAVATNLELGGLAATKSTTSKRISCSGGKLRLLGAQFPFGRLGRLVTECAAFCPRLKG